MKKNLTDIAASLQAAIGTATVPHVPAPPPTPPADSGAKVAFRAEGMDLILLESAVLPRDFSDSLEAAGLWG